MTMFKLMELAAEQAMRNWNDARKAVLEDPSDIRLKIERKKWQDLLDIHSFFIAWERFELPFEPDHSPIINLLNETVDEYSERYTPKY